MRTRLLSFFGPSVLLLSACALLTAPAGRLSIPRPGVAAPVSDGWPEGAPADPVAAAIFARINEDRAHEGLPPVAWDQKAADLATEYTREQIREGTVGHFLLDGLPPYARLSRIGDLGMGAENSVAYISNGDHIDESPLTLALRGEREMLAEKPPSDGHRRAILDPAATHVGVGWSLSGADFRMAEEFVSRRYAHLDVSPLLRYASAIRVRGQALPGMSIAYVSVARQPFPSPISLSEANSRHSYAYPDPRFALLPAAAPFSATGLASRKCLVPSLHGRFSFEYQVDEPGMWTFVLYFQRKGEREPAPGGCFTVWVDAGRRAVAS
ncbi:MAG TPA: CAP domain-containing protein [Thermoanaerobaculia bacterium]|nr:CAP domain-containing protein [Thermoanaerobaculia bacterium]